MTGFRPGFAPAHEGAWTLPITPPAVAANVPGARGLSPMQVEFRHPACVAALSIRLSASPP
jgi:hypothetical protein